MLSQIKQELGRLSPAEARVAAWLLADPQGASSSSLAEAAAAAEVSEPTVIRFARRFGSPGFRAFKNELIAALHSALTLDQVAALHEDVTPGDSVGDAAQKVLGRSLSTLLSLSRRLDSLPLEEAVSLFAAARQWLFCGLGASGFVAGDAAHKFFRLGRPARAVEDAPTALQTAAIAGPGDLLVFISHAGRWPELVRAARIARDRGAAVLAITQGDAALAAAASCVLDPGSDEDTHVYTPMSSRIAQLALLDALQVAVAIKLGDDAALRLRETKAVLATR